MARNTLIHPNYHRPLYNVGPDGRVGMLSTVTSSGLPIYEDTSSVNPDVLRAQEAYAYNGGLPSIEEEGLHNIGDVITMLALPVGPVAGALGKGIWGLSKYGANVARGAFAPQPRFAYAGANVGSRARPNAVFNEGTNWSRGAGTTVDGGMPTGVSTSAGTIATKPATEATVNTVGKEAEAVANTAEKGAEKVAEDATKKSSGYALWTKEHPNQDKLYSWMGQTGLNFGINSAIDPNASEHMLSNALLSTLHTRTLGGAWDLGKGALGLRHKVGGIWGDWINPVLGRTGRAGVDAIPSIAVSVDRKNNSNTPEWEDDD